MQYIVIAKYCTKSKFPIHFYLPISLQVITSQIGGNPNALHTAFDSQDKVAPPTIRKSGLQVYVALLVYLFAPKKPSCTTVEYCISGGSPQSTGSQTGAGEKLAADKH